MKIIFEIEEKGEKPKQHDAVFSTIAGRRGWVQMEIDGRVYEFGRPDFTTLAAALDSIDEG